MGNNPKYKNFYSLGDSLSDNGAFVGILKSLSFAQTVKYDAPCYEGRSISDGSVAIEHVAKYLGRDIEPGWKYSFLGKNYEKIGKNYAIANATAAQYDDFISKYLFNKFQLKNQVNALISQHKDLSSDDLIFLMIGGNDVMRAIEKNDKDKSKKIVEQAVKEIGNSIKTLYDNQVRNIIISNLPNLELIPAFNQEEASSKQAKKLTESFNTKLAHTVKDLQEKYSELKIKQFDLYSKFNSIMEEYKSKESQGFNYNKACTSDFVDKLLGIVPTSLWKKLKIVQNLIINGKLCVDPAPEEKRNRYLFFDWFHPTKNVHEKVGEQLCKFISLKLREAIELHELTNSPIEKENKN